MKRILKFVLRMPLRTKILWLALFFIAGFASVSIFQKAENLLDSSEIFQEPPNYTPEKQDQNKKLGCYEMVEDFCNELWSPENHGNISLTTDQEPIQIFLGKDKKFLDFGEYTYLKAILDSKNQFPKDFKNYLEKNDFFVQLEEYLNIEEHSKLSPEDLIEVERNKKEALNAWQNALEVSTLERLQKIYPNYMHQQAFGHPSEWFIQKEKVEGALSAEIYSVIWGDHNEWYKMISIIDELKETYIEYIQNSPTLSSAIKGAWIQKIASVQPRAPGAYQWEEDATCKTGELNAYYLASQNTLTVCSGYFGNTSIYRTITHELSHSLGYAKLMHDYENKTKFAFEISRLTQKSCSQEPTSCSDWIGFKSEFESKLQEFNQKPDVPLRNLLISLQPKPVTKNLTPDEINRLAKRISKDYIEERASNNAFMYLIAPTTKDYLGVDHPNITYMNPCFHENYKDDFLSMKNLTYTFFVNEYRCSTEKDVGVKMKTSISTASKMMTEVLKKKIFVEGKLSDQPVLMSEGFSSDSEERFADFMGQEVLALYLSKKHDVQVRRNIFLSTMASKCDPPSLGREYPKQYQAQKEFYNDAHSEAEQRRKELLTEPIRKVLDCR